MDASLLASDDNNPAFVNPTNPDDVMSVEFYDYKALDQWKTRETGIKTYLDEYPYIRISKPGDKDTIIERPAIEADRKRWPKHWLWYQMQTGKIANADNVPGWQIDTWDELDAGRVRDLKHLRFFTVEQIAHASDSQIGGIGMGGVALRNQAQEALRKRNNVAVAEAVATRDNKIAAMEAQMEEMRAMMAQLLPKPAAVPDPKMDAGGSNPAREKLGLPKKEAA